MSRKRRIIDGYESQPHSQPWLGTIMEKGKYICGVSLIARSKINTWTIYGISAAHCFYDEEGVNRYVSLRIAIQDLSFLFGVHDLRIPTPNIVYRRAHQVFIHPEFDPIKDDIAVVEFDTKIYFNDYVRPICLPPDFEHWTSRHRDFQSCLTCGWGIVNSITRRGANSLNCIEVPIYTSKFKGDRLTYKMSHVKWQGAMKGSYLGDSGSPYVCRFSLDEPFLVYGITSGVIEPKIDRPYSYNVFIVVHLYLKWILDTIKSLEEDKPNRPPTLAEKLKTLCSSFKFSGCYRVLSA